MTDLIVLGTDTDAGKTTFCLLWLTAFGEQFEYWKPIETGASDFDRVCNLTAATAHPPVKRFRKPVAPLLAAQAENDTVPTPAEIIAARPRPDGDGRHLLIESFGSPFSPLTADRLQIDLIKAL